MKDKNTFHSINQILKDIIVTGERFISLHLLYSQFLHPPILDMLFIHGTITGPASLTSCLLAQDLFWVLSLPRWQLFIHSIPRRNVIPPQLLWNGAQPQFYFRHLRCVVVLQPYTSDI